jgi:hypothetical protein
MMSGTCFSYNTLQCIQRAAVVRTQCLSIYRQDGYFLAHSRTDSHSQCLCFTQIVWPETCCEYSHFLGWKRDISGHSGLRPRLLVFRTIPRQVCHMSGQNQNTSRSETLYTAALFVQIVAFLGGFVWFFNCLGKGSVFLGSMTVLGCTALIAGASMLRNRIRRNVHAKIQKHVTDEVLGDLVLDLIR